jgi:gliding motility-associated-like protein
MATAQEKFWTGGSGNWNDPQKWSSTADGIGGAGVPRIGDEVNIVVDAQMVLALNDVAWCSDLSIDATRGRIAITGSAEMNISGDWRINGDVIWEHSGQVRLIAQRGGHDVDLKGTSLNSDVVLDGGGSWNMVSDLVLRNSTLIFKEGTLIGNTNKLQASRIEMQGRRSKSFIGGGGVVMLEERPAQGQLNSYFQPGNSILVINGQDEPWNIPQAAGSASRDVNVCGTGGGQMPIIVNAQLTTNYNGYGVSCRGICNATVTVSVNGGVGPFTYQWLNSGPSTSTWTTACGGPQIVIVTDLGQGISCPASVNVSEPGPLGVIFFGQGTPPTCADVCDGSRTALAVGGVSPYTYNWNNGAGTSSSFNQLCAGLNTLQITDNNGCIRDTTFFFNLQPIQPNLTFTPTTCFGECDGTATVSPSGGTGNVSVSWTPAPPVGQGTTSVSGLCAGNWSVTLTDANGCDTTMAFAITEPPPITASTTVVNASCAGTCDGTASVLVSGVGPFIYSWSPPPGGGQGTAAVTGLCEGTYNVTVTDQPTGCDTVLTVIVDAPPPIVVASVVTDVTCSGSCNGSIALQVSGGTPGYTYTWNPAPPVGQGTATATGLCVGAWSVIVVDAIGCDTILSFTITEPPPLDPGFNFTNITCNGICDGSASAAVSGGVPGYTYTWTPAPSSGQGTATASGFCAGLHQLLIVDANGCDTTITFTIIEPPPLQATPLITSITCSGECDGAASINVSGGTPGYTFQWSPEPGSGQGTAAAGGLCPGNYTVLVTDANGCELPVNITIDDAVPIQASLTLAPASCPGVCDGTATAVVTGGTGPYTYNWTPAPGGGQGSAAASGLCPQDYSLTVTDSFGCDTTLNFTISAPIPITATTVIDELTCANDCDGSITVTASGGNGVFTYVWSPVPPIGQGTATASGLCAGSWSVTLTSGSCDTTLTFTLAAPLPITVIPATVAPTCNGSCDGSASVAVSGGTPSYTYTWTPAPPVGQGTSSASGLCAGNYSVLISDAAGCDTTVAFVITAPPPITGTLQIVQAGCGGSCDGSATITVQGGTPPYSYSWGPGTITGQGTPTASGLCPGNYIVLVTDAAGCTATFNVTILQPVSFTVTSTVEDADCAGSCDGSIAVSVAGGSAPYSYVWSPQPGTGQGTATVGGLCAGSWQLLLTDAAGCDTLLTYTIDEPPPLLPNESFTNESCNGPCDGTASVAPSGGTPPYTFTWSPVPAGGQGTATATGLCEGIWSVLIVDAVGCDTTVSFIILPQQIIVVDLQIQEPLCSGTCSGSVIATASGGIAPYTYTWSPAPPIGQGTDSISGLCIGTWQVLVADANGCDTTITFNIQSPPPIDIDVAVTSEDCSGPCTGTATATITGGTAPYSIVWQPEPGAGQGTTSVTGLCAGSYTVDVTDDNGCTTQSSFTIDPFSGIIANLSSVPATCADTCNGVVSAAPVGGVGPFNFNWSPAPAAGQGTASASGFCAGMVTVTITDAGGCVITDSIMVDSPEPLADNAIVVDALCWDACTGSITVAPSGGVGPYEVYWSPVPQEGQLSLVASGLCMGTQLVQIIDANGCDVIFSHEIFKPDEIIVQVSTTPSECASCIGAATATVSGGTPGYQFSWIDGLGNIISTADSITDVCAGLYSVQVEDANGCIVSEGVPITDPQGEQLTPIDGATTCPTSCDGSAEVSFTCSDPPCDVSWADAGGIPIGQTGTIITGLCAGSYFAMVTNATGCMSITEVNVVAPAELSVTVASTSLNCAGACSATASLAIAGGQLPYSITWDPAPANGQGTAIATGLCTGTYTVDITDASGCVTTVTIDIPEPAPLVLAPVVTQTTCSGDCTGSIIPNVSGGTPPYNYAWSPAIAAGADGSIAALCSGTYSVTVSDANGCTISQSFTIDEPLPLIVTATSTESNCPACDGTASAVISGGTGPFTFSWTLQGTPVGSSQDIMGLCGGLYVVTVSDVNGCSGTASVVVPDNNSEVLSTTDGSVSCANDCDGSVSVSFTCSDPPCTTAWMDSTGNIIAQNVLQVDSLCIGTYFVEVINGSSCSSIATAVVSPVTTIDAPVNITDPSCAGSCDGSAEVLPSGGTAPYTFSWTPEPGGGQGTSTATGLCAGTYDLVITDATGCDTTIVVIIADPQPISIVGIVTEPDCAGSCDGTITAIASGGVGTLTYTWSPVVTGQGTNMATELCAGDYSLTVTDQNGCISTETWTLSDPDGMSLTGSTTPSECGLCIGGVSVSVAGGTPAYAYSWTSGGNVFGTDPQLNGLCAGLYSVQVIDATGCTASLLVPVTDIDGEVVTMNDGVTTCAGACDGEVSVDLICAFPPCDVEWFDATGVPLAAGVDLIGSLCAGDYLVMVTNASGCVTIDTASVADPEPIVADLTMTEVSCFGECDGSASVSPSGGTLPYTFNWQPAPPIGQGTSSVSGLCAQDYIVTITDSVGCSIDVPFTIDQPEILSANITVTPITCNNACDGVIDIAATGGIPPYDIVWSPVPPGGQGITTATDLCAGTYSISLTDQNGCENNYVIELQEPEILLVDLQTTDNSCFGLCNGTGSLSISGGATPYTITWTGPQGIIANDTISVDALCAGDYTVNVTDANGCAVDLSFTITSPTPIDAGLVVTGETCDGPCDGTATVNATGGAGGFTFFWQPDPASGQGTDTATGLCAGAWSVTITDLSGCDTTIAFTIDPFTPITASATVTDVLCADDCNGSIDVTGTGGVGGLTYSWAPEPGSGQGTSTVGGLCAGDYIVTISDQAGCDTTITYTISAPSTITVTIDTIIAASCSAANDGAISITVNGGTAPYIIAWAGPGGFASSSEDISGIAPGTYSVTVTDDNGCSITTTVDVGALSPVLANAGPDQQICAGTVTLDGSGSTGATAYEWTDEQGNVMGTDVSIDVTLLQPGDHLFTLTASDGPCISTDQVLIVINASPLADAGPDQTIFVSGSVTLGGSPTTDPGSTIIWSPDSVLSDPTAFNPVADPSITTWFQLIVTDPNGCQSIDSVLITVVPEIVIPTGFTPNGDGWNDGWVIDNIDLFPECVVEIYNRWGEMLFRSVGYKQPWDGRYNGGFVPVGTYYYVVELNSEEFPEPFTGPLTVIR